MADISTIEPLKIAAGDTATWKKSLADYPASAGWALTYAIKGPTSNIATINASASGDDFLITIPAATTAGWAAGDYWWAGYVSKGSERHQIGAGTLTVSANLAVITAAYDGRTHVKRTLDAIRAVLEGRATQDQMRYVINGRELMRTPIPDLLKLRAIYEQDYASEQAAERVSRGLGNGRKILTRFA